MMQKEIKMKRYDKLVRDKIPAILVEKGKVHTCHVAEAPEFSQKLKEKLAEEVKEYLDDPCLEELADIQEVIYALVYHNGWSLPMLDERRVYKHAVRGGFERQYILEAVEE
jgi:predicted house-cleaning noncanonical NTP pyrophosphatase (MazG superfamily)